MRVRWGLFLCLCGFSGCRWPSAPPAALQACRVDLDRLVASLPSWEEVGRLEAQIRALEQPPPPAVRVRPKSGPPPLAPFPDPGAPPARAEPPTLAEMVPLGEAQARAQDAQLALKHQERLEAERVALESALAREKGARRSAAAEEHWREWDSVVRRYQAPITALRLRLSLLEGPAPLPAAEEARQKERAQSLAALKQLEEKRNAELQQIAERLRVRLQAEDARDDEELARTLRDLEEALRRQREDVVRTTRQEWEERLEQARAALAEPPPGPTTVEFTPSLRRGLKGVRIAPAGAGGRDAKRQKALASLKVQRARLQQFLREETRRRVLAIARQHGLEPHFEPKARSLPDRTEFFARQLGR